MSFSSRIAAPRAPRTDTRWFDGSVNVPATASGIFTPSGTSGRHVRVGEVLGEVRDYAGRPLETLRAPINGYLLYGLTGPPVRAADPVVNIGIPSRAPL